MPIMNVWCEKRGLGAHSARLTVKAAERSSYYIDAGADTVSEPKDWSRRCKRRHRSDGSGGNTAGSEEAIRVANVKTRADQKEKGEQREGG